jgi:NAD(P)H-dependent flavin oxidoreductase YrpB (nitropropane dioxygenase family)
MMLRTRLCELLGIAHPIVCASMGWITGRPRR